MIKISSPPENKSTVIGALGNITPEVNMDRVAEVVEVVSPFAFAFFFVLLDGSHRTCHHQT